MAPIVLSSQDAGSIPRGRPRQPCSATIAIITTLLVLSVLLLIGFGISWGRLNKYVEESLADDVDGAIVVSGAGAADACAQRGRKRQPAGMYAATFTNTYMLFTLTTSIELAFDEDSNEATGTAQGADGSRGGEGARASAAKDARTTSVTANTSPVDGGHGGSTAAPSSQAEQRTLQFAYRVDGAPFGFQPEALCSKVGWSIDAGGNMQLLTTGTSCGHVSSIGRNAQSSAECCLSATLRTHKLDIKNVRYDAANDTIEMHLQCNQEMGRYEHTVVLRAVEQTPIRHTTST